MFPEPKRRRGAQSPERRIRERAPLCLGEDGSERADGVCCYVVMRLIGIDFAATWALLIFFLNFIPNIGSIVGLSLPALVALVQFDRSVLSSSSSSA